MGDYFNTALLIPSLDTVQWMISNVFHMIGGILIPAIGISLGKYVKDPPTPWLNNFSLFSGILFFIVGISGFAALNTTHWLNEEILESALIGFSIFRYTLLLSAIVSFGLFIAMLGWLGGKNSFLPTWFSYVSYLIALVLFAFIFVPVPVPLVLFVWSVIFGFIMIGKR